MIGMDVGTFNLVCARRGEGDEVKYRKEINSFIELPLENRYLFNMMKKAGVPLIEKDNVAYVVGEAAVNMAYTLKQINLKRPMKDGCLNSEEQDAFKILSIMIHSLIGKIDKDKEVLYYCVPANAVNRTTDADYHTKVIDSIFKSYKVDGKTLQAYPINEALALIYAELGEKQYTGAALSCLCPGTKIYTDKGIVNIEDVVTGDKVVGKDGKWDVVYNTIVKEFKGRRTKIVVNGSNKNATNYQFVDNHKLYVKRNDRWVWAGCESIIVGDIVGEPIIQHDKNTETPVITLIERKTCSKIREVCHIKVNPEMCRLIGLFLGDGSVNLSERCIQFDFANKEEDNIVDTINLLKSVFNKNASRTIKSDNCTRIKCYNIALTRWFKDNCYRLGGKKLPFKLSEIDDECCRQLVIGLLNSDGIINKYGINFYNTDTVLIHLARQAMARCGIGAYIQHRYPRINSQPLSDGRIISGKKNQFVVGSGSSHLCEKFSEFLFPELLQIKNNKENIWIEDGFICARVKSVEYDNYHGNVYDLQVSDSHSFSGPGLTISNCGAGMANFCYAIYASSVCEFSSVNCGDWIDQQAAKATNESITVINKAKNKIDLTKTPTSTVERAIQTQYRLMVEKTINNIKKTLLETNAVKSENPIDLVVAGGTSSPNGFVELVTEVIKEAKLPIETGEIRRPEDHLFAVARGLLIAAEVSQQ